MDLSPLPMLMIGNIAKYLDHVELIKLRKESALFNNSAKQYGIGRRIPVQICRFNFNRARFRLFIDDIVSAVYNLRSLNEEKAPFLFEMRSTKWQHILELLDKVTMNSFIIVGCVLDSEIEQTLRTYADAFRHCRSLEFDDLNIVCSKDDFIDLLNIFPKADKISTSKTDKNEYILNYEFLSSRKWAHVYVHNWGPILYNKLDDSVLDLIVANRTSLLVAHAYTSFTVQGVAKALKTLSGEGEIIDFSNWGFLDAGEKDEEAVQLFRVIPGISVQWNSNTRELRVTFEKDPEMIVQFKFYQLV